MSNLNNIKIHNDSVENILKKEFKEKFNIFFLDPPFKDLNLNFNIANIKNNKIYKKNHIVIIHREKKIKDNLNDSLDIIKIKEYGRSKILFGKFS